jgi:XXXCH domain-containing protein
MNFREVKSRMQEHFDAMLEKAHSGEIPLKENVVQFHRLSRQFHSQAQEDWLGEAEDFITLVDDLHQAVRHGNAEEAIMLMESIQDSMSYCHRMFLE